MVVRRACAPAEPTHLPCSASPCPSRSSTLPKSRFFLSANLSLPKCELIAEGVTPPRGIAFQKEASNAENAPIKGAGEARRRLLVFNLLVS